jgi:hypothetical protein
MDRKRRTPNTMPITPDHRNADSKALQKKASEEECGFKPSGVVDLETLYTPWVLLPSSLQPTFPSWEDRTVPVVFTQNQNIKAGVHTLLTYLNTTEQNKGIEGITDSDAVIAVSAQAEGISKLASIIEITKRALENQSNTWYAYSALSSREIKRKRRRKNAPRIDTAKDEDDFESLLAVRDQEEGENLESKIVVPQLTVWISGRKMPQFMDSFGEQTFRSTEM